MLERLKEVPILGSLLSRPLLAAMIAFVVIIAAFGAVSVSQYSTPDLPDTRETADWLTVHYVSMDNNLDAFGEWQADLNSLEKVGSSPESQHIALYDGDEDGDTVVQYVLEGGVEETPSDQMDQGWGAEMNLGDPETLAAFTIWAATEYPAENICLVLNNHGGGWFGICWDDTDDDYLTPGEVAEALEAVEYALGRQVNVVLTYACLMASTEFAYEISGHADYLIGSETFSWGSEVLGPDEYLIGNYPFDAIWGPVKDNPEMSPKEFAIHVLHRVVLRPTRLHRPGHIRELRPVGLRRTAGQVRYPRLVRGQHPGRGQGRRWRRHPGRATRHRRVPGPSRGRPRSVHMASIQVHRVPGLLRDHGVCPGHQLGRVPEGCQHSLRTLVLKPSRHSKLQGHPCPHRCLLQGTSAWSACISSPA